MLHTDGSGMETESSESDPEAPSPRLKFSSSEPMLPSARKLAASSRKVVLSKPTPPAENLMCEESSGPVLSPSEQTSIERDAGIQDPANPAVSLLPRSGPAETRSAEKMSGPSSSSAQPSASSIAPNPAHRSDDLVPRSGPALARGVEVTPGPSQLSVLPAERLATSPAKGIPASPDPAAQYRSSPVLSSSMQSSVSSSDPYAHPFVTPRPARVSRLGSPIARQVLPEEPIAAQPFMSPSRGVIQAAHVPAVPSEPLAMPPSEPLAVPPSEPIAVPPSEPIAVPPSEPIAVAPGLPPWNLR